MPDEAPSVVWRVLRSLLVLPAAGLFSGLTATVGFLLLGLFTIGLENPVFRFVILLPGDPRHDFGQGDLDWWRLLVGGASGWAFGIAALVAAEDDAQIWAIVLFVLAILLTALNVTDNWPGFDLLPLAWVVGSGLAFYGVISE